MKPLQTLGRASRAGLAAAAAALFTAAPVAA